MKNDKSYVVKAEHCQKLPWFLRIGGGRCAGIWIINIYRESSTALISTGIFMLPFFNGSSWPRRWTSCDDIRRRGRVRGLATIKAIFKQNPKTITIESNFHR